MLAIFALSLGSACKTEATGALVIGVTSDYRAGVDLRLLDVSMTVDGEVLSEQQLALGPAAGETSFPAEFAFEDVAIGSRVGITLRGYESEGVLKVVRHIESEVVATERRLLRSHLEATCALASPGQEPRAPICNEPATTCIGGECSDPFAPGAQQEPYREGWSVVTSDVCKSATPGPPQVIVGEGQSDYLNMEDYALAEIEAGPQGGHHVWVAARIKDLNQSGSITEVGGEIPSLGLSIAPLKVIFTFDPDEGGYCKIYGLRFQLDIGGDDIMTMLGQELKVIVRIKDISGAEGVGERWVTLSDYIL
ncbi:MAG TPA: hypothetical protein VFB62_20260 [Polyangiaceae bacterium]|nr:hypothetical protein [Polyangiaceae bacterium]